MKLPTNATHKFCAKCKFQAPLSTDLTPTFTFLGDCPKCGKRNLWAVRMLGSDNGRPD